MLQARLAAATAAKAPAPEGLLLPYDLLRDYLCEHSLLAEMQVDPRDVHAALVALQRFHEGRGGTGAEGGGGTGGAEGAGGASAEACPHCRRGYVELDAREGHRVCRECGAVLTLRAVNVEREWIAPVEDVEYRGPPQQAPKGVPRWMLEQTAAHTLADPSERRSRHWSELEHWNAFAHLTADELARADRVLRDWSECTRDARMAAVLLWPRLKLPAAAEVRQRLRQGAALPLVDDGAPAPRFACSTCGVHLHSAKEARVHCAITARWGTRKRRRL